MPRIELDLLADGSQAQREFRKTGRAVATFDRDLGKSVRGMAAASLSFHGLGRAASYASGYFLAGGGIIFGLKEATRAAIDFQASQGQLSAAVKASGINFAANRDEINANIKAQQDLGFSAVTSTKAYTLALRATKDVQGAQNLQSIAANVARGRNMDLVAATQLLVRVQAGQIGSLRRLGIEVKKGITGQQALAEVSRQYAGAADKYSTSAAGAQARLTNALHETEITIGTALLPTITKYSGELSTWLEKSKNQERIQRDVNTVVRDLKEIVQTITPIIKGASGAVGGLSNAIKLLIALKVVRTLFAWRAATIAFGASAGEAGAAGSIGVLAKAVTRLASIGAVSIAIRFPGLAAGLAGLASVPGAIAAATAAAVLASSGDAPNVSAIPKKGRASFVAGLASNGDIPKSVLSAAAKAGGIDPSMAAGNALKNPKVVAYLYAWAKQHGLLPQSGGGAGSEAAAKSAHGQGLAAAITASGAGGKAATKQGLDELSKIQDSVAQARLAVAQKRKGATAQLVAALKAEIDYDAKYAKIQEGLAAKGGKDAKKHAATMQALLADETSALSEINSTNASAATKRTSAMKKADQAFLKSFNIQLAHARSTKGLTDDLRVLETEKSALQKRLRVEKGNQFLQQALATVEQKIAGIKQKQAQQATTFTVPLALQIAQAKASTTATTADDISVARRIKEFAEKTIKSNKKKGQAIVDAWNQIATEMAIIGDARTTHRVVTSSSELVKGIHFASLADKKAAEQRFAQAQAHGGVLPTGHPVLGQTIHTHVYLDKRQIAEAVTEHSSRKATHVARQTRGPVAGRPH